MMKVLKILGLLVLVVVVGVFAVVAKVFIGMRPLEDGLELRPGVRLVQDGYVSAYLVDVGEGQVALVDCGNPGEESPVLKALAARGLGPEAVQAVFLTHGHRDHAGGCTNFPNARVYAHKADVPLLEGKVGSHGPLTQLFPAADSGVRVSGAVEDGAAITVGEVEFRAYGVPGHTPGSTAWLARDVLFFGDAANADKAGALTSAAWPFSDDVAQSDASVAALAGRLGEDEVQRMAFGHAGPVSGIGPLRAFAHAAR